MGQKGGSLWERRKGRRLWRHLGEVGKSTGRQGWVGSRCSHGGLDAGYCELGGDHDDHGGSVSWGPVVGPGVLDSGTDVADVAVVVADAGSMPALAATTLASCRSIPSAVAVVVGLVMGGSSSVVRKWRSKGGRQRKKMKSKHAVAA